jgi:MFS family permease
MDWRNRFPALASRDFRLLWLGQGISSIGSQMQFWAINWHLWELTREEVAIALVGLFRIVPIVLFSLLGGAVADAWNRRRVMLATQSVLTVVALALGLLTQTHSISALSIYLLSAAGAAAMAFDNPARQSLIPNLVPRDHLLNALSLNSVMMRVATISGPVAAGFLIKNNWISATYFLNALSFLAVIVALLMMRPPDVEHSAEERPEISLRALREGLEFVRKTPILVWTITLDFLATFFASADALLPVIATDVLQVGPEHYGYLAAAPAVGSLIAGAVMAVRPPVIRQGHVILLSVLFYGGATILFGASRLFWLTWFAYSLTGLTDTVSTILRQTIRQTVTPDRLRGRMTAVNMIFFMGGPRLGEIEAAVVARWVGADWSVILGGIGCVLSALWVGSRAPALRHFRLEQKTPE